MKLKDKIQHLGDNHFSNWLSTRLKVENDLSEKQTMFCICGKLATGMHESKCKKFNDKVNSETVKRLEYLILPEVPK